MTGRQSYPSGVPCWVDLEPPEPRAAIEFYGALFGWRFEDRLPPDAPQRYAVATLEGATVAAVGSPRPGAAGSPMWNTYVCVDDVDGVAATAATVGGRVLVGPEDVGPPGRMAIVVDPSGAELRLWQPGTNRGAQTVNADNSWNWSNLETPDPTAVVDFYREVFGWELATVEAGDQEALMWRRPGYGDFLAESEPGIRDRQDAAGVPPGFADAVAWMSRSSGAPRWHVTFAVADAGATTRDAERLGGTILAEPYDAGAVQIAELADPQGAEFTVSHFDPERL